MIFYASPVSSYSAKVRIVLRAKHIAFEERLPPGGYRSAAYREIVPMGTLPAIDDAGFVLSESEVINEYLEERFPQPAMLPRSHEARARTRFFARFHDLYLEPPVRALFGHIAPAKRDLPFVAGRAAEILRRASQLSQMAQPQPYLATSFLSLADCGYAVTLPLARRLLEVLDQPISLPPNIAEWEAMLQADPAVADALLPWRAATDTWLRTQLAAPGNSPS